MAVYSQFATGGFDDDAIAANESYVGAIGAYQMMEESSMNQNAIFNHVLGCDFVEAQADHGFVSESTLEAVNEASESGIFGKVVAFFQKLIEKIKGIINNMIKKIEAMFTKDGKKLVNKFKKDVQQKMNNGEFTDSFKYKWSKFNESKTPDKTATLKDEFFDVKAKTSTNLTINGVQQKDGWSIAGLLALANKAFEYQNAATTDKSEKENEELQKTYDNAEKYEEHVLNPITSDALSDYKDAALSAWLGQTTSVSDFAKDVDDEFFPDGEEEEEGLTNARLTSIISFLENDSKTVTALNKSKSLTEKKIKNTWIKPAQDINKKMNNLSTKKSFRVTGAMARSCSSNVITMGNALTACSTMIYSAWGAAFKKNYAQCRAVFIKAATYKKKSAKNEAALLEAVVDVSNYEVDQMMPEF